MISDPPGFYGYLITSIPIPVKCGSFVTTAAPIDRADAAMIASAALF